MARLPAGQDWPVNAPAGLFLWRVATEYANCVNEAAPAPMSYDTYDPERHPGGPTHLQIQLTAAPHFNIGILALRGRGTQGNGESWEWDGNLDAPTLKPSINRRSYLNNPGWHGWLRAGVLVPVGVDDENSS